MAWRKPTAAERALVDALLGVEFPGRDALRAQWQGATVEELDEEGSLAIRPGPGHAAEEASGIPVDARGADSDGGIVEAYLHVEGGRLSELEVVKPDGSPLRRLPEAWDVVPLS